MANWPWPLDGVQKWFEGLWDWISEAAVNAVAPVSEWILDGLDWLKDQVDLGLDWLAGKIGDLWDDISGALATGWETITKAVSKAWGDFRDWVSPKLEDLKTTLGTVAGDILDDLKTRTKEIIDGLGTWADDVVSRVKTGLGELGSEISGYVDDAIAGGMDWVTNALSGVAEALGEGLKAFWTWFVEGLRDLVSSIMELAGDVKDAILGTLRGHLGGILDALLEAVSPESPDEAVKEATTKFAETYLKRLMELAKIEKESVPELDDLLPKAVGVIALNMGAAVLAEGAGAALDQVHPIKNIGFGNIAMDLVASVQMPAMIGPMLAGPIWPGIIVPLRYRFNEMYPTTVPETGILADLASRGLLAADEYTQAMKFHALDETWSSRMLAAAYRIPGFPDLQMMVWRGAITEDNMGEALRLQGVRPEYVEAYGELLRRIPGPVDLVRMAVREAFTREELDAEFPEVFAEYMLRQGYEEIWAKYFWRAHWVLVPLGQLYEMYHRGLIGAGELSEQLKYHDYPPEWRDRLMAISWMLPGRIDARWMFRWGEIDIDGLRDLLVMGGLDPAWADRVASAYAKNQWLAEINRLRDNLKRDYIRGYRDEPELRIGLKELGYPPDWIEYHVRDAVEDGERELKDDMVDALGDGYLKDLVDDAGLETGLKAVIVRPDVVQMELERLYIRKYVRPKTPEAEKVPVLSVSTLRRAFRDQIIDEATIRAELAERNYTPEDIDIMVAIDKRVLEEELREMPEKIKTVSLGTLRVAFRQDIITEDALRAEMSSRNYPEADITLVVALETRKKEEAAAAILAEELEEEPERISEIPLGTLRQAFREDVISEASLVAEMTRRGYPEDEIQVVVSLETRAKEEIELELLEEELKVAPEKIREIPLGTLRAAFREEIISEGDFRSEMATRGYVPEDVDLVVELEMHKREAAG